MAEAAIKSGSAEPLSAQQLAIESGAKTLHGTVTDRVARMYQVIRSYGPPRVTLERSVHRILQGN
jgi:hypothetical protein